MSATERVTDPLARVSYRCPPGWRCGTDELIAPFTLAINDGSGGVVASGRWDHLVTDPPSADELIAGAAWLASEYGELLMPGPGDRTEVTMENTTVAGKAAARAGYLLVFHPDQREPAYVRVLVVALAPGTVSFVLGVSPEPQRHVIDGVLATVQPAK